MSVIFALGAASLSTVAPPLDDPWTRISSPDGSVSVEMPCNSGQAETAPVGAGFKITCAKAGLTYGVVSGIRSATEGGLDFDALLAKARSQLPPQMLKTESRLGRRAFEVVAPGRQGVPYEEVIDYRPGSPLIVTVEEGDDADYLPEDTRASNLQLARRFYTSLKVSLK